MKNILYSCFFNICILNVCVVFTQDPVHNWRLAQDSVKRNVVDLQKPIGHWSALTSQKGQILRKRELAVSDVEKLTANEVTKTATTSSKTSHEVKPTKTPTVGEDEAHDYQGVQPAELSNQGEPLKPSERNKMLEAPKDPTSRNLLLTKLKTWIQNPLTNWFHEVWKWIRQFFKSTDHEPLRIYHASALDESPFRKTDVQENSQQKSLEMLIQRLSSLTSLEDPEGVAKAQLQLLQHERNLDKIDSTEMKRALILPATKQMSLFDSSIPLREAEWQLLEHVFTFSNDPSVRESLYRQYQMDDEFRRGVCFAASTVHLRELQQLQSFPVNSLTREILEIFRVSNWGEKDVGEVRISGAEDLFLEFIKEKGLDPLAVRSLLKIPEILENVSQKSLGRMRNILGRDKEFISILAIASNELWPGTLSESLPNSSWIYRLLRDHESARSFDDMIKSEHAGVSMWPNSPSEELKERKGATERKKLVELFHRRISPRSPYLLELQILSNAFLDSPGGKNWMEEQKVNSLTDHCLSLIFSNKFDISTRAWIHSALEHLKSYGFPAVISKINTAFDLHRDILTDIKSFWYMDSYILLSGNDKDSARVRWFAGLLQKLTTRTKWTDILAEHLTFKKTMDYLLEELKNDSLSIAKGRMQLYEMLLFVLNHFEVARDKSFIDTVRDDPFLLKCLGALSVLSGTDIDLDLKIPRQATGFGFGLNKGQLCLVKQYKVSSMTDFASNANWTVEDLSIDEPYLKLLKSRGQMYETGMIHNGDDEKIHRRELIEVIEQHESTNELPAIFLGNLANRLSELKHIGAWDKNDVDPNNSHSLTEAMVYYFENVAVSQGDKMLLSKILEFLFENNAGLRKEASSYINPGLQRELDLYNYLNTVEKYSAEGTNTHILRINSEIVKLSSELGKGKLQKSQQQLKSILEAIISEIGMNDWAANEHKVVSSMLVYLAGIHPSFKDQINEAIFDKFKKDSPQEGTEEISNFVFNYYLIKYSLNVDPFFQRLDQYHRDFSEMSRVRRLEPAHRELFKQLQIDVHGIISSRSALPEEESNLDHCVRMLRGTKISWNPRSDHHPEDSIFHLMVYILTQVRKDNATFGAITGYKLILSYIQEILEAEEIREMMENAMTVDKTLRNKMSAAQTLLDLKHIRHERGTPLDLNAYIGHVLATKPETWDKIGETGQQQARTWARTLVRILKRKLEGFQDSYDSFRVLEEIAKLSKHFSWSFVQETGKDEVLAKEIGIYVAGEYRSLDINTFPIGSVSYLLLEEPISGSIITQNYLMNKIVVDEHTTPSATNIYKQFSEMPTRWTETSSSEWRGLLNCCLSSLKSCQAQEIDLSEEKELPINISIPFYILSYLTAYCEELRVDVKRSLESWSFYQSDLQRTLRMISEHQSSLVYGSDFFDRFPGTFKPSEKSKSMAIQV
ncbi:uncharacterized protein MELLADRAFT_69771 [Melampsora larici-populina 98AG31]|uniref:Secreted protein n=1 Tax=Melampsora larici-populina (strain 98AG31 / pathotype 3-4-7) TaxID=747676 RepID=F4SC43_MELLP|nr:uncharacterized protein MELLADRAFT_69771 [Melampsora larici-populina 98AG31]EGF97788.1 hypothetical protein MELLADRAFT_69771 [Melampsora larici-populina 98AG31]